MGQITVKPKAENAKNENNDTPAEEVQVAKKRSAVRRMTRKNEPVKMVVLKRSEMSDQKKLDIASIMAGRKITSLEEAEKILFGKKKKVEKKEAAPVNESTRMQEIVSIVKDIVTQHVQQQLAEKNVQKKVTVAKPVDNPAAFDDALDAILTAPTGTKPVKKMTEKGEKEFFKDSYYYKPGSFWQRLGL